MKENIALVVSIVFALAVSATTFLKDDAVEDTELRGRVRAIEQKFEGVDLRIMQYQIMTMQGDDKSIIKGEKTDTKHWKYLNWLKGQVFKLYVEATLTLPDEPNLGD
jgi:hypothetical protein